MRCRLTGTLVAVLATTAVVTMSAVSLRAQDSRQRVPFAADPLSVSADIVEAMRLINTNPEAAVALLHRINAHHPNRDDVLARLAYALEAEGFRLAVATEIQRASEGRERRNGLEGSGVTFPITEVRGHHGVVPRAGLRVESVGG